MAYIGVSPGNGVRKKHTYTADASQTSFTGAGAEGVTLSYKDSNFVDVYQNGVKLAEADYTSTSGTTVVLAQAAAADDIVEIIVYDVFSVADTVSKADGGTFDGNVAFAGNLSIGSTAITSTAAELNILDGVTSTAAELNLLDGVTSTTAELNILDGVTSTAAELNLLDGVTSTTAELNILDGVTSTAAELNALDGITAVVGELNALDIGSTAVGTAVASKAVILDSSKDYTGIRNLTISGELDAATLDISGDADIDGTLEADAMTLNGTAITTVATLSTGISNGNLPVFTSGVADDDFLRVNGTSIEGRSASEVLSDIGASAVAGSSSIVTSGALNAGSITSGFGAIDNGASAITTTGVGSFGSLDISGDIDVDGTTNLDVVDIDGAVNMATTLLVTGNVDFNGDLDVAGTTNLDVVDIDGAVDMATTLAVGGNVDFNGDLDVDGTTNLDAVDIDGTVTQGSNTSDLRFNINSSNQYGLKFFNAGNSSGTLGGRGADIMTFSNAAGGTIMEMNAGQITKPLQPAFRAQPASTQSNIPINATTTVAFGTERFDQNNDFASNTFTAPVTGKYHFDTALYLNDVDSAGEVLQLQIITSNSSEYYDVMQLNMFDQDGQYKVGVSALADMDASDTAYVRIYLSNAGTAQMDINVVSYFSGYLVC